jgi:hyperosmotically inducible periplasmic protein
VKRIERASSCDLAAICLPQLTCRELFGAKDVNASSIHIKTRRGIVWLTGTVPRAADKERAQEIVEGLSGVRSVRNRLKVVAD